MYSRSQEFCGLDGSRLVQVSEDPLIGRSIERYTIDRALGSGGMARVYRAKHKVLDRRVAIKILYGELASDRQLARRFAREARSLSRIRHQHVVEVLDFGRSQEGLLYMIMELVEGYTLSYWLRNTAMSPQESARIIQEIAQGLEAAHASGYVHRDLKPQNVVLDRQYQPPTVKILDFGLVGLVEGSSGETPLTRHGAFFGTPTYMSPEQSAGETATPASDMYALGVVLYELLTGKPPFSGEVRQLAHQHLHLPPKRPTDTHPGLTEIALRLLAKAPEQRLSSRELISSIENLRLNEESYELSHGGASIAHDLQLPPPSNHPQPTPAIPRRSPVPDGRSPLRGNRNADGHSPVASDPHSRPPERASWSPFISDSSVSHSSPRPQPLTVAVPIDRDEFSVLDGSSTGYEQRGSGYRRFLWLCFVLLFLTALGAAGYTVYSHEVHPAPLAPTSTAEGSEAETTDTPVATSEEKNIRSRRRRKRAAARNRADSTDTTSKHPSNGNNRPRESRSVGKQGKNRKQTTAAVTPTATTTSAESTTGRTEGGSPKPDSPALSPDKAPKTDILSYSEFLEMDDTLAGKLRDANISWAALEAVNPADARQWGRWFKGRVDISLQEAQTTQEALSDTMTKLLEGDRSSLTALLKVIKEDIDTLPDHITELTRTPLFQRFYRLEDLLSQTELPGDPATILQALESLKADIREFADVPDADESDLDASIQKITPQTSTTTP